MKTADFTTTFIVDQTPEKVFNAITNVRGWWSEEIEGSTDKLNDEFNYHFEDIHRCRMKITELIPDQKVVWLVLDNYFKPGIFKDTSKLMSEWDAKRQNSDGSHSSPGIELIHDKAEWVDTKISFEISTKENKTQLRFTHIGLVPEYECFEVCVSGWTHYIRESLFQLITTGKGQPNSTGTPMTAEEEKFHAAAK
jgi:hypothetical protein